VSLFNFNMEEIMSFFAVLVRYSMLFAVLPFVGDKFVPGPIRILLALAVTAALFPALVRSGAVRPGEAIAWGSSPGGIIRVVGLEAIFGLLLGFVAKISFDCIAFGSNLIGNFMGFASASTFDPHQESQSQIISQVHMALAMMVFLALDGHHLMLVATLDSYRVVGVGRMELGGSFGQTLVDLTGQVIRFGMTIAAPMAISVFAVNVAFGVVAKAMPQMNILVLSFAVIAIVGFVVMLVGLPEFHGVAANIFAKMGDNLNAITAAVAAK
jgi:flagellar biosynthesis protein FliR